MRTALNRGYSFGHTSSDNNGNAMATRDFGDFARSQQFAYHRVNRLFTAATMAQLPSMRMRQVFDAMSIALPSLLGRRSRHA
jgi:hypothetical protein